MNEKETKAVELSNEEGVKVADGYNAWKSAQVVGGGLNRSVQYNEA